MDSDELTVLKQNPAGDILWTYSGRLVERDGARLVLEAFFDRDDRQFHGMPLLRGDRFVETYYTDRWYNVFAIYSRDDGSLRGWYCNITRPARFQDGMVSYVDLALDLLVFPDGRQLVLDEDEFAALNLSPSEQAAARQALAELQTSYRDRLAGGQTFLA